MNAQTVDTTRTRPPAAREGSPLGLRLGGIAALAGIIYVHWMDLSGKLAEVRYLGIGYIALMVGCVVAAVLLGRNDRASNANGWRLAGLLASATFVGFVLNRTIGLPRAMEDKGNWGETLGVWSLVFEGALVIMSVVGLRLLARSRVAAPSPNG